MADLIILSNRRDLYIHDAIASAAKYLEGIDSIHIVDDSGDPDHHWKLLQLYNCAVHNVGESPSGYAKAMSKVLEVGRLIDGPFFFLEEDFLITEPVDLLSLEAELQDNENLAQVALIREPWFRNEKQANSVLIAQSERVRRERGWGEHHEVGGRIEHDYGFTGNPAMWSPEIVKFDFPQVKWAETAFGEIIHEAGYHFAYLNTAPVCAHIGAERSDSSHGY